jgi:hypothetical protein
MVKKSQPAAGKSAVWSRGKNAQLDVGTVFGNHDTSVSLPEMKQ